MNIVSASFRHEFYFMVFIPLCSLLPSSSWSWYLVRTQWSFPGKSAGKESTCNAGDPGSIPGLGRSPREGICYPLQYSWAFPGGSDGKEFSCNVGDLGSIPGLGRFPWRREGLPTPVFLPGESHGQRSLAGYRLCSCKESDTTEQLSTAQHKHSMDFPGGASGGESACQCRNWRFNPWVGKIPKRKTRQPTAVLLPRESHGQGSLAGYSP